MSEIVTAEAGQGLLEPVLVEACGSA